MKFLVVRFSSIGDIVLTTPVVRCLRATLPGVEIHYLTKSQYAPILVANPYIDKVHVLKSFGETVAEIKAEGFDYIIDLHKSLRSLRLRNRLKILDFTFPKLNFEKWLLVHFKCDRLPQVHIVDRYFEAVRLFDVVNDGRGLDFFIRSDDEVDVTAMLGLPIGGYVVFAIGGRHATKQLPASRIVDVCKGIRSQVVLLGGSDDADVGRRVSAACSNVVDRCGQLSIGASASVLRQSAAVVTHDTGLMHIAAAFHKDIVSIWGNTVPAFGMYPYLPGPHSVIFEVQGLKCRPCSKLGFDKCPHKHFNCMQLQDTAKIAEAVNQILETSVQ